MKERPLVSVIITAYNRTDYLQAALASVGNQSYKELEVVVVDDGSESDAVENLVKAQKDVRYLRKTNGGIASARNYGIEHTRGDYIAFLDDDDTFMPHRIEVQLQAFKNYPGIGLVHSAATVIDKEGQPTGQVLGASTAKAHLRSGNVFWNALGTWLPKAPTVLLSREALGAIRFHEGLQAGEDADFYQRFFYSHTVKYIEEPLACYREHDTSGRLSKDREAYLGLSGIMFDNLKAMGIKNRIRLKKIARKLALMEARNYAAVYHEAKPLFSPWHLHLFPIRSLKQYISTHESRVQSK